MKRWFVFLINFVAVWALAFTSACSAGRPSVQVMGNTPTAVPEVADTPLNTNLPPATAQATTGQATTPSGQKRPRPTKSPQDTRQPARGEPSGAVGGLPTGTTTLNPDFIATEILGRPTDTTITVNIVPAVAIELHYEYGTVKAAYNERSATHIAAAGEAVETSLSGLQPDTRYYYRLRYRSGSGDFIAGQEHTFMTQRSPGSTFTFAIQGDSHPERVKKQFDATLYTRTLQSASAAQPDFYMIIGDDFSVDTLKTVNAESVRSLYINQRQWLGMVGAPVLLVNGNHEQASLANLDGTPDNVAVWAQTARNTYYPQPAPDAFYSGDAEPVEHIGLLRDYYAFTWGEALFVVIDPYWHSPEAVDNPFGVERSEKGKRDMWNVTLGETQYQWLKHTLEASTARYKFVFAHHVLGTGRGGIELAGLYEWGGKDRDGSDLFAEKRPGWEKPIHQLMADNHVTIFFQGHDHIFVRQELDGVIYQTLPEPANPFYTYENDAAYQSGDKFPNSGHVRVTVSPGGVKVDYIRSFLDQPDELAYSYTVKPDPASTPMAGILPTAAPSTGMPAHDPAMPEKTRRPYRP
jgi:hypothetical protein